MRLMTDPDLMSLFLPCAQFGSSCPAGKGPGGNRGAFFISCISGSSFPPSLADHLHPCRLAGEDPGGDRSSVGRRRQQQWQGSGPHAVALGIMRGACAARASWRRRLCVCRWSCQPCGKAWEVPPGGPYSCAPTAKSLHRRIVPLADIAKGLGSAAWGPCSSRTGGSRGV